MSYREIRSKYKCINKGVTEKLQQYFVVTLTDNKITRLFFIRFY